MLEAFHDYILISEMCVLHIQDKLPRIYLLATKYGLNTMI